MGSLKLISRFHQELKTIHEEKPHTRDLAIGLLVVIITVVLFKTLNPSLIGHFIDYGYIPPISSF